MIGIINYGMGNLRSVQKGLERVGHHAEIIDQPDALAKYPKLILPGVGAFGDAMKNLRAAGLEQPILDHVKSGKLLMGICLGLQLLFDSSEEDPGITGLGIIPGQVKGFQLDDPTLKVPQMGWNGIHWQGETPALMQGLSQGDQVYFVHGYYAAPETSEDVMTTTDYGIDFCSSVSKANVMATQFHPEKSQTVGLRILKNFGEMAG